MDNIIGYATWMIVLSGLLSCCGGYYNFKASEDYDDDRMIACTGAKRFLFIVFMLAYIGIMNESKKYITHNLDQIEVQT